MFLEMFVFVCRIGIADVKFKDVKMALNQFEMVSEKLLWISRFINVLLEFQSQYSLSSKSGKERMKLERYVFTLEQACDVYLT